MLLFDVMFFFFIGNFILLYYFDLGFLIDKYLFLVNFCNFIVVYILWVFFLVGLWKYGLYVLVLFFLFDGKIWVYNVFGRCNKDFLYLKCVNWIMLDIKFDKYLWIGDVLISSFINFV